LEWPYARLITLAGPSSAVALSGYCRGSSQSDSSRSRNPGLIIGTSESAQDISFDEMFAASSRSADFVCQGTRTWETIGMQSSPRNDRKQWPHVHHAETARERTLAPLRFTIGCFRSVLSGGAAGCPAARAGSHCREKKMGRGGGSWRSTSYTRFLYALMTLILAELNQLAPRIYSIWKTMPVSPWRRDRSAYRGTTLTLTIDRDHVCAVSASTQLVDDTL